MPACHIGIRSESKNRWERRAPLSPADVRTLVNQQIKVVCQPSSKRIHTDAEYQHAGARISSNLSDCPIVVGVQEPRSENIERGRAHLMFSHTHHPDPRNMPLLRAILDRGCTLIDHELITDDAGNRRFSFGYFAGLAGMLDALWALGRRLAAEGFRTPLIELRQAFHYDSLDEARAAVTAVGHRISALGLAEGLPPLVCAIAGSGNAAHAAQEILDLLPVREISPSELPERAAAGGPAPQPVYRLSLPTELLYERKAGGGFDREEYREHPQLYQSRLERMLPWVDLLVHAIDWEEPYPRLAPREALARLWPGADGTGRLKLIADISCDIGGSVEATVRSTTPDAPTFLYLPHSAATVDAWSGAGPLVLANDDLACELPREVTREFGRTLTPYLTSLVRALDAEGGIDIARLPAALRRATIAHRGRLTERFADLERQLAEDPTGPAPGDPER